MGKVLLKAYSVRVKAVICCKHAYLWSGHTTWVHTIVQALENNPSGHLLHAFYLLNS